MLATLWTFDDELLHQRLFQEKSNSFATAPRMPDSGDDHTNDDEHKGGRRHSFSSIGSNVFSSVELDYLLDVCADEDTSTTSTGGTTSRPQPCSSSRTCDEEEWPTTAVLDLTQQENAHNQARTSHILDGSNQHTISTSATCHTATSFQRNFGDFVSSDSPPRRHKRKSADSILAVDAAAFEYSHQPKTRVVLQSNSKKKKSSKQILNPTNMGGLSGWTPVGDLFIPPASMPAASQLDKDTITFDSKKKHESYGATRMSSTHSTVQGSKEQEDAAAVGGRRRGDKDTTPKRRTRRRSPVIGSNKYEPSLCANNAAATVNDQEKYPTKTGHNTTNSSIDIEGQARTTSTGPQGDAHLKRLMNFMVASDTTRKMLFEKVREAQTSQHERQNTEEQQQDKKEPFPRARGQDSMNDKEKNHNSEAEQVISLAKVKAARRKPRSSRPPPSRP